MLQSMESLVRLLESYRGRDKVVSTIALQGETQNKKCHFFRLLLYEMQLSFKAAWSKQLKHLNEIMMYVHDDVTTITHYI